jgi:class 3 adenylate cyclase
MQDDEGRFLPVRRVVVVIDLAGYAKAFHSRDDAYMAALLDEYYARCEDILGGAGGVILKFMGDGCLATFDEPDVVGAVQATMRLGGAVREIAERRGLPIALGANIHLAPVIETELGPSRRRDVVGRGVNQAFLQGRGPGIRISEPVYRSLPSEARSVWTKHKPPAVYEIRDS